MFAGDLSPVLITCHLGSIGKVGTPLLQLAGNFPDSEQKLNSWQKISFWSILSTYLYSLPAQVKSFLVIPSQAGERVSFEFCLIRNSPKTIVKKEGAQEGA